MTHHETFPERDRLWCGAILCTIGHAIWIAGKPLLSYELAWDGPNYIRQDSQGTYGTITFSGDRVIGVFFDHESPRSPFGLEGNYDIRPFFAGIPTDLLSLAYEQTLQYVFDEYNGMEGPIITAAFWSEGEYLTAAEPWSEVFTHGAHLVRIELMEPEAAIKEWQAECEWSASEVMLLQSLFHRKMATPDSPVVLEDWEQAILRAYGTEGIDKSRELLAAIGIILP